jgi:hypothetical protein
MSTRSAMWILAGTLALAPAAIAQQDHAVPRGGGGGGSSGGSHPSPGVHSSGGGSSSSGSSYVSPPSSGSPSLAERRHPRAGTGRGSGGYYPGHPAYPGYPGYPGWGGGYYPGWGWSYWWPYSSYGWYGGYGGYPWGWGWGGGGTVYRYVEREGGSIRVLVDPSEARVYVDGYYAGTVDDYDGLFQRLNVSPGRHEIALKLEGFKTHRVKVYVSPSTTLKLHYEMQKGQGETFEDLAGDAPEPEVRRDRDRIEVAPGESDEAAGEQGALHLRVEPPDASVYVDGAFKGTGREARTLTLPRGRHRVEVVRPGYGTRESEVEVQPGEPTELSIVLARTPI